MAYPIVGLMSLGSTTFDRLQGNKGADRKHTGRWYEKDAEYWGGQYKDNWILK